MGCCTNRGLPEDGRSQFLSLSRKRTFTGSGSNSETSPPRDATSLASDVDTNEYIGVVATKKVVKRSHAWSEDEEWQRQEELAMPVFHSADAAEGAAAFAAKRPPRWQGR